METSISYLRISLEIYNSPNNILQRFHRGCTWKEPLHMDFAASPHLEDSSQPSQEAAGHSSHMETPCKKHWQQLQGRTCSPLASSAIVAPAASAAQPGVAEPSCFEAAALPPKLGDGAPQPWLGFDAQLPELSAAASASEGCSCLLLLLYQKRQRFSCGKVDLLLREREVGLWVGMGVELWAL